MKESPVMSLNNYLSINQAKTGFQKLANIQKRRVVSFCVITRTVNVQLVLLKVLLNPFHATGLFLYPPERGIERDQWHEMS